MQRTAQTQRWQRKINSSDCLLAVSLFIKQILDIVAGRCFNDFKSKISLFAFCHYWSVWEWIFCTSVPQKQTQIKAAAWGWHDLPSFISLITDWLCAPPPTGASILNGGGTLKIIILNDYALQAPWGARGHDFKVNWLTDWMTYE